MEIKLNREVLLGEGGYASVFSGTFRGREVAVKRVVQLVLTKSTANQEEIILMQLDHLNIVKCFHWESDDNFK
jgi:hypothetical protein